MCVVLATTETKQRDCGMEHCEHASSNASILWVGPQVAVLQVSEICTRMCTQNVQNGANSSLHFGLMPREHARAHSGS